MRTIFDRRIALAAFLCVISTASSAQGWRGALGGLGAAGSSLADRQLDVDAQRRLMQYQAELDAQRLQLEYQLAEQARQSAARRDQAQIAAQAKANREELANQQAEISRLTQQINEQRFQIEWAKVEKAHPDVNRVIASKAFESWAATQNGVTRAQLDSAHSQDLIAAITTYKRSLKQKGKAI